MKLFPVIDDQKSWVTSGHCPLRQTFRGQWPPATRENGQFLVKIADCRKQNGGASIFVFEENGGASILACEYSKIWYKRHSCLKGSEK